MARRTYTPDEYQAQRINYYDDFGGINVNVAAAAGEEEKKEELPNVLTPVSARGEGGGSNPLTYSTMSGKSTFKTERIDPTEYIKKFANKQKVNLSDDGFQKYLEANAGPTMAGLTMGPLVGGLAYGAASLNRKRQLENARKIQAQGGGFMVEYNGQTISRAPGSRFYEGTLGGMTQDQFAAIEAIQKGFIPGTFRDNEIAPEDGGGYQPTGKAALYTGSTFAIDAYGNLHSASGIQGGRAFEAEEARQGFMRQELDRMGLRNVTFTDAQAREFITQFRSQAGAGRPFAGFNNTVRTMDDTAYAGKVSGSQKIIENILGGMGFTKKDDDSGAPPPVRDSAFDSNKPVGNLGFDDSDGDRYDSDPGGSGDSGGGYDPSTDYGFGYSGYDSSQDTSFEGAYEDDDMYARGGRVGMQEGGAAQRPLPEAGFVAGPPENFTERETVADDQNGTVAEGTFVINAAAVEYAGSDDIRKMILDAYSTAREKGLDIGRVDRKLYEGTVDVALSKGEVVVPPELAKIIGYDRLEKINNRGKKEVSRRQKKAGGGFLDGKKYADGGEIYEDRIIMEEVRRKMDSLLKNLPDDVKVDSRYYGDDYPARRDFHRQLAILNDADPDAFNMRAFSSEKAGLINVPQTPTLFNLYVMAEEIAHLEASKNRRPETETVQTLRADEQSLFASIPGTEGDMRTHYGAYEQGGFLYTPSEVAGMSDEEKAEIEDIYGVPADKVRNTFSYPDYFELEQDYLEEMRAKSIAFQTVFGNLDRTSSKNVKENTKTGRAIDLAESSYGENFAKYILATASPTLQAAIFHKHPELRERYFDDRGRFKKRNIQPDADFRMAMQAEDKEARERTLKEFREADDRNIVVRSLTSPRKSEFVEGYGRISIPE